MKKITLASLFSALSFSSFVHAGGMGDSNFCCSAFTSFEIGYTANTIDGYNFTLNGTSTGAYISTKKNTNYTGRLAAGMISMMEDDIGITGELGWGYYGRTNLALTAIGRAPLIPGYLSSEYTLSGFDALLGVAYVQPYYSFSFKLGALIQNMQIKNIDNLIAYPTVDILTLKTNSTAVLPEVKLGAAYNINPNWAITGAYVFALGSTPKTTGNFNTTTSNFSININTQNPTLNSLLLGVQYTV